MPLMYAKVFAQIFDSSIANNYALRHFFMDLLVLAEIDGVIDMTPEAIAARTRIPLEDVTRFLVELESPDPRSRSAEHEGRRIIRLDDHRDWGWRIVNYNTYRQIASEEQRRYMTRKRVRKHRKYKLLQREACNAPVTLDNAGNAMQKQKEKEKEKEKEIQKKKDQDQISDGDEVKRFRRPTEGQCEFYASKIGLPVSESSRFFLYYESKGWKVGNSPMKSWEAAMRGWKSRWEQRRNNSSGTKSIEDITFERMMRGV